MIDNEVVDTFKTSDRIQYFLNINRGDKGKVTELLKILGFKHKSMFYTRMNSNSWTLEEVLTMCNWWDISINDFIGISNVNGGSSLYLEERMKLLEDKMDAILAK